LAAVKGLEKFSLVPGISILTKLVDALCLITVCGVCLFPIATGADEPKAKPPAGSFIRFRVDEFPAGQKTLSITAAMKIHSSPWVLSGLKLTPKPVTVTGWTEYVDLRTLPGRATGSLVLQIPPGAKGITRFSRTADDAAAVRDFDWGEPDGTKIIVTPDLADVRTFREQERRYYIRSLQQTGERLVLKQRISQLIEHQHAEGQRVEVMLQTGLALCKSSFGIMQGAQFLPRPRQIILKPAQFDAAAQSFRRRRLGDGGHGGGDGGKIWRWHG